MSKPARRSVTIIGAGISGLVLGRCLRAKGIPAIIYDRGQASRKATYSITLLSPTYQSLADTLGLSCKEFHNRVVADSTQGFNESSPFRAHRGRLETLLADGLDVRWEHSLVEARSNTDGTTLTFDNGEHPVDGLVVGADGIHSKVRSLLVAPDCQPKILPLVAYNGKCRIELEEFKSLAKYFDGVDTVETRIGSTLLQIYANDRNEKHVSLSYSYSRPPNGASDSLHQPDRPKSGASEIPEALFAEVAALDTLDEPFATIFNAERMRKDRLLHWLMRSVLPSLDDLKSAAGKNAVLLGDALHGTPIIGSKGANVAVRDSVELADAIAGDADLGQFYDARYASWQTTVQEAEEGLYRMHSTTKPSL